MIQNPSEKKRIVKFSMVVDSSVWIEILCKGELEAKCHRAMQKQVIRVPTIVLFEIYKKLKSKASEDIALDAVATLSKYEVLDMTRKVSLQAADISLQHNMHMADSIVLAHADCLADTLLTLDNDFSGISRARVKLHIYSTSLQHPAR